ncbi:hypothetical protein DICVIV_07748 [Dictyocaulus viviparus]|uniref:UTP23 sensor motif region domain-containing protein n=1 Tax=Dictyocaulus viviparus TaxID=29172 RepID=A0A0D8XR10_DICVI|nr:hypothetical protein DICVIV_07748 [Dictyocaulus viviparus]
MSKAWEIIKRNKGKIITGGILVSGIAACVIHLKEQRQQLELSEACSQDTMKVQARRQYIFDTNHRSCDQSIIDIVPNLKSLVKACYLDGHLQKFDVEALIRELKDNQNLPVEEKVQIWNRIKILSIARLLGISYSYSLLTLALKAQISILAADVCSQYDKPPHKSWLLTAKSQILDYLGIGSTSCSTLPADTSKVASNRNVFIQCIQYLTLTGILKLLDVIDDISNQICSSVSLTDYVNNEKVRDILNQGDRRLSMLDPSFYSQLVAPLSNTNINSQDGVIQLLTRLIRSIESKKFCETLSSLVDFYFTAAVHKLPSEPVVLAKLLPSFSDVFDFISSVEFDSPLQNSLCSSDVHHSSFEVEALTQYKTQSTAYGSCVAKQAEGIRKDACAKEFNELFECVKTQLSRKKVLVDGTFCNAALTNKINLREQLPKYLMDDVEIVTTKCVIAELERLGSPVYGALVICRQFAVDFCPHTPCRLPAECLAHLARRASKKNIRYIIATNDNDLSEKLRTIAGTPILYIKYNAILFDRVSQISKDQAEVPKSNLDTLKAIKAAVFGEPTVKIQKKKKIKGPNPLSCKKKKRVLMKKTEKSSTSCRRKRKRKQVIQVTPSELDT